MMIKKTVSIRDDQEKYIKENHLALSRFIQDQIDKLMKKD